MIAGRRWLTGCAAILLLLVAMSHARAAGIRDMAGRTVEVPATVKTVWSAYPPLTYLIYALDPSLLIGWNYPPSRETAAFLPKHYRDLPVVGGWFGQRTPNIETLALLKPQLALVWDQSLHATPIMARQLGGLGIPVVAVRLERISDYPETIQFLGRLLNRQARAAELAKAITDSVAEMRRFSASIPAKERRSVFYAIGPDGLNNDCNHMPFLQEAIDLAGARSAHACKRSEQLGSRLSMEQVIAYDPDVIITQDDSFFRTIWRDARWQHLRAVRQQRVYRIPSQPFNWLNYPPSFMRAIGIKWLAATVYPERFKQHLPQEIERFFKLFFGIRLEQGQAAALLDAGRKGGGGP